MSFAVSNGIREAQLRFVRYGDSLYEHVFDKMQCNEAVLAGFAALFGAVGETDEEVARRYAREILKLYPHIFALEIVAPVSREQLPGLIARQREKNQAFNVRTFAYEGDRQWRQAPEKAEYYPIIFVEPMRPGSEKVLGLDVDTVPFLRQPLHRVMHEAIARSESSHPFRLVENNLAYVMFRPVSRSSRESGHDEHGLRRHTVELVVTVDKLLQFDVALVDESYGVILHHQDFAASDPKGQLIGLRRHDGTRWDRMLFPAFHAARPIPLSGQPFTLIVDKQVTWSDMNPPLMWVVTAVCALSFFVLLFFARSQYLNQGKKLEAERQLQFLAHHDGLTGLPNRSLLKDRLEQAIAHAHRQAKKLAVLFIDINRFKQANDTYGHAAGDELLKIVANKIRANVRAEDTVARYSGDEFVVILDDLTTLADTDVVVNKIHNSIAEPTIIDDHTLYVSASIGVAIFPIDGQKADALLKVADIRMYENKQPASIIQTS